MRCAEKREEAVFLSPRHVHPIHWVRVGVKVRVRVRVRITFRVRVRAGG